MAQASNDRFADEESKNKERKAKAPLKIKEISPDAYVNVAIDTIEQKKQALVFVNSKKTAESSAEKIAKKAKERKLTDETGILEHLSKEVLHLPRPTKQCEKLADLVKLGIAFHHAGLTPKQRELIEDNFRNGNIKIICSTPTLAAGVDLPAFRTIIKDVKRYVGHGMDFISVLEYLQQAGRAGRPGKEDYGEAIIFAPGDSEKTELHERFIMGEPEEIYSKLAVEPVLRTYVLSLIATGFVKTKRELLDFFEETFYAKQFKDMERLEFIITKMIGLLDEFEFINIKENIVGKVEREKEKKSIKLFKSALDLAKAQDFASETEKLESTELGRRVAELYIDPLTANFMIGLLQKADLKKEIEIFAILQMISHTIELRPLLRVKQKDFEDIEKTLNFYGEHLLEAIPPPYDEEYDDYLNSIKTAELFNNWINEADEEVLLEKYDIRPGEVKVKLDNADWLLYSAQEIAKIMQLGNVLRELNKARLRLKHGAKEELLPLLKLEQVGRVRARKMFSQGIKDLGDIRKADFVVLSRILGKKIAENVLEQVGRKVSDGESRKAEKDEKLEKDKKAKDKADAPRKDKQEKLSDY